MAKVSLQLTKPSYTPWNAACIQARAEAEARLQEEAALREIEQRRLQELEELQRQLEALLEEERQAKKDEELVRAAQARWGWTEGELVD